MIIKLLLKHYLNGRGWDLDWRITTQAFLDRNIKSYSECVDIHDSDEHLGNPGDARSSWQVK